MNDQRIAAIRQTIQAISVPGAWFRPRHDQWFPTKANQACLVDTLARVMTAALQGPDLRSLIADVIHPLIPDDFKGRGRKQGWSFMFSGPLKAELCDVMHFNDECPTIEPVLDVLNRAASRLETMRALTADIPRQVEDDLDERHEVPMAQG